MAGRAASRYTVRPLHIRLPSEVLTAPPPLADIRAKMKWTLLLALFAIFYHLAVAYLG